MTSYPKPQKTLILGATSAIAQETAKLLAQHHHHLFLIARDPQKLAIVAQDLQVRGASQIHTATFDLNQFEHHDALFTQVTTQLQGIDIVLIAHGSLPDQHACEQDYSTAEAALRTNFLSTLSLLTKLANYMQNQGHGCLAVISSVAGDRARQSNYIYGTAKGALNLYLQGLRNRLHRNHICVLTIKPGFVDTPMTQHFKKGLLWAQPQQIAHGIVQAIEKRKDIVYLPWFWQIIMLVIKTIPEPIFKRLKL